ncbi:MAG: hypothetical protein R8M38_09775 [Mariprofundaceae bacterium]
MSKGLSLNRIWALAHIVILDGIRRHAIVGLFLLALLAELSGLLFMDFFGHDIGRASSDFLFSVMWLVGLIFLFFHAVQLIAWDEEKGVIYALLSRPVSRAEYVIGTFTGLTVLLTALLALLAIVALITLFTIQGSVDQVYFPILSLSHFILAWFGMLLMLLMLLAVIILFSGMMRGGFPVLLLSASYYLICSGLPVVREMMRQSAEESVFLVVLGAVFPDFSRLDFKDMVVSKLLSMDLNMIALHCTVTVLYVVLAVYLACILYDRRDLQ